MNRLNKFLIIFIMFSVAMIYGFWLGLQSNYFASIVTEYVNERFISKVDANVEVNNIKISLIPLGMHLESVKLNKEEKVDLVANRLSFLFSPWDFLRKDLRVDRINLENGLISIAEKENKETKDTTNKDINVYDQIRKTVLDSIPFEVGELSAKDIALETKGQLYKLERVIVRPYKSSIDLVIGLNDFSYNKYHVDTINTSLELLKDKVRIKKIDVFKEDSMIQASGVYTFKNNAIDIKSNFIGRVEELLTYLGQKGEGYCKCSAMVKGTLKNPIVNINMNVTDGRSPFVDFEELNATAKYRNSKIDISKVEISKSQGVIKLSSPMSIVIGKEVGFSPVKLDLYKARIQDFLKYPKRESYLPYYGKVSGPIDIELKESGLRVYSNSVVSIENFKIGEKTPLLNPERLDINELNINLSKSLSFIAKIGINDGLINVSGMINKEGVNIQGTINNHELSDLGGSLGKIMSGKSNLNLEISGNIEDIKLRARSIEIDNAVILDYGLKKVSNSTVVYHFNKNLLELSILEDLQSRILVNGFVDFNKSTIDLGINGKKLSFSSLPFKLKPIWKNIGWAFSKFTGDLNALVSVKGSFEDLSVKTNISTDTVAVFNEVLDNTNVEFTVDKQGVKINKFVVKKGEGEINGTLDLENGVGVKLAKISYSNIDLVDLKNYRLLRLGYDGKLQGDIEYSNVKGHKAKGILSVTRAKIGREVTKPSVLKFNVFKDQAVVSGNLLGGEFYTDSNIYFASKAKQKSTVNFNVNVKELKKLFGILSVHNIYDTDLSGQVKGKMNISFSLDNFKDSFSIYSEINEFELKRYNKMVSLRETAILDMKKSKIEKMFLNLVGNGGQLKVKGSGDLNKDFKIEQDFNVDVVYLSLLSPIIERAEGVFQGRGVLSGNFTSFKNFHEFNARRLFLKVKGIPIPVESGSAKIILNDNLVSLNNMKFFFGSGQASGDGSIELSLPFPKTDIKWNIEDVNYPISDKSFVSVDGGLFLKGEKLPYQFFGDLVVNNGKFEDDIEKFSAKESVVKNLQKYVDAKKTGIPEVIDINLRVKTAESITMKNRISDLLFFGDLSIQGNINEPKLRGQLEVVPTLSKFKFKGNDFTVINGVVLFDDKNLQTPIGVNFVAQSKIAEYEVKLTVTGGVEDIIIDLESNPSLSKEDIFSLLTLGVTTDYTKNLQDKDRASLTTLSLGNLIVDQLRINERLDSTLGLRLSVLPEVSESDENPLRAAGSDQQVKLKTATKLKIQKKVSKNVDITFSNTFGSSEGQKQEINLDLNLNNNFSIEGVIERVDGPQSSGQEEGSAGADIKYKWSF